MAQVTTVLGAVTLMIDTAALTAQVTNNDPTQTAVFNIFDPAAPTSVVWTYSQAPNSTATIPVPTVDNFGHAITYQVGQVTNTKTGTHTTGILSPPWQLTFQA